MLTEAELERAEEMFQRALRDGEPYPFEVLGWGELSAAVAFETASGQVALKRLPPFPSESRWAAYRDLFREYVSTLAARGVEPVETELRELSVAGARIAYSVQPRLPASAVGPRVLRDADDPTTRRLLAALFDRVTAAVDRAVGLDAQLSNWALVDGEWRYFDLTTPLLRDSRGRDRLDTDLFLAALPTPLRPVVRRFLLRSITATYYATRTVLIDFLANLHKERLKHLLPTAVGLAAERAGAPIGIEEVRRYYRSDARMWSLLLALRRFDRTWQRNVLRRPYPFLLPGPIER